MTGLVQGKYPEIFARIGVGWGAKKVTLAYSSNISETRQDRTKVTFVTNEDE